MEKHLRLRREGEDVVTH